MHKWVRIALCQPQSFRPSLLLLPAGRFCVTVIAKIFWVTMFCEWKFSGAKFSCVKVARRNYHAGNFSSEKSVRVDFYRYCFPAKISAFTVCRWHIVHVNAFVLTGVQDLYPDTTYEILQHSFVHQNKFETVHVQYLEIIQEFTQHNLMDIFFTSKRIY